MSKSNLAANLAHKILLQGGRCETAADLAASVEKVLPKSMATQAQGLIADRAAVTSLLQAFTGDPHIGDKLDAIYGPSGNKKSAGCRRGRSKR